MQLAFTSLDQDLLEMSLELSCKTILGFNEGLECGDETYDLQSKEQILCGEWNSESCLFACSFREIVADSASLLAFKLFDLNRPRKCRHYPFVYHRRK